MKIIYLFVDFPFTVLRDFTIPCCIASKWNKKIFILNPLVCSLFAILITNSK